MGFTLSKDFKNPLNKMPWSINELKQMLKLIVPVETSGEKLIASMTGIKPDLLMQQFKRLNIELGDLVVFRLVFTLDASNPLIPKMSGDFTATWKEFKLIKPTTKQISENPELKNLFTKSPDLKSLFDKGGGGLLDKNIDKILNTPTLNDFIQITPKSKTVPFKLPS